MMDMLLLFGVALVGGGLAFFVSKIETAQYKLVLVFSGAYLFAITITHLLPELFEGDHNPWIGILILVGFFLQQGLEFVSQGVEHGHIHHHKAGHAHKPLSAIWVLMALGLHAFLEGGLLANGHEHGGEGHVLLGGVLLHKAPEAFALMSVLLCELSRKRAFVMLLLFALASPLGLWLTHSAMGSAFFNPLHFTYLVALVCGSLLHISTTIVFESSADHKFNARKMLVALLGTVLALAVGWL